MTSSEPREAALLARPAAPAVPETLPAGPEPPAELPPTRTATARPASHPDPDPAQPPDEAVGQRLGRYKLLERVGEGGCGVVYVAEQTEPVRRRVALKVIKLGMDTKQVVARFEAERQALAMMDHPNIAKVLDAGTTEAGRPYFVMELVRGIRITDYCDQAQLSTGERLDLFIKVCQAIQHAHQKGIIHRDIKPSNILVKLHDGVPVPKVIDFGIAKATAGRLTDQTVYTELHQFIGTPAYMSPEQAEMSSLDIDTRSDIYSLGVLLYELLAGSTPFDSHKLMAAGLDAMRKIIREQEPQRPSTKLATLPGNERTTTAKRRSVDAPHLIRQLSGDLDWIVMKCLEKDRTRRYDTANDVAADLLRHLANEPILAHPSSAVYRLQKAWIRNRLAFLAVGAVVLALVLGLVASLWLTHVANEAKEAAKAQAEQKAEVVRFLEELLEGTDPKIAKGRDDPAVLREFLEKASARVLAGLRSQPAVAAELVRAIGRTYGSRGDFDIAARFQTEAWNILQRGRRDGTVAAAMVLDELGRTYQAWGKVPEATNALGLAVVIARRTGAERVAADAMLNLAFVHSLMNDYAGAEKLATNAIVTLKRLAGATAPATLTAEGDLAGYYFRQGRYPEAQALATRVLNIQRRTPEIGSHDPEALRTLSLLVDIREAQGAFSEAEILAVECVDRRKQVLGLNHSFTLASMDGLGILYSFEGRFKEAAEISRQAFEAHVRRWPEHADSLAMKSNLAEHLRNLGRYAPAEQLFKEVIATYQSRFPDQRDYLLETRNSLSILYVFAGRDPEAEVLARANVAERRKSPQYSVALAESLAQLATTLIDQRKWTEAATISDECLNLRRQTRITGWQLAAAAGQHGLSLLGLGRSAEAEAQLADAYREMVAMENSMPAIEKVRVAEVLQGLDQIWRRSGRKDLVAGHALELKQRWERARRHDRVGPG